MTVEAATYVGDLDDTYPSIAGPVNEGDDHIRLLKRVLANTFPGAAAAQILNPLNDTGSVNAVTITPSPAVSSLQDGTIARFTAAHTNTGKATLSVGAYTKDLKRKSEDITTGEIEEGHYYAAVYVEDDDWWELIVTYPSNLEVRNTTFLTLVNNGGMASGGTIDVDWRAGNFQKITASGAITPSTTINFDEPPLGVAQLKLIISPRSGGSAPTVIWSATGAASLRWKGSTAVASTSGAYDILDIIWDPVHSTYWITPIHGFA